MLEDKNKNVWIAGDGLCRWNRKKNKIDTLIPYPNVIKTVTNYMRLLDCDSRNNLWLASYDNEIIQYDCNANKMHLRLAENSMIDGHSVTSSEIINDHIWLGMANGISAFNIKDHSIKQFNYSDGLPSAVVTSHRNGSFYDAIHNRFYFGAGQYLISFTPDIQMPGKAVPLFSVDVSGENQVRGEKSEFPYSKNNVELTLNAINFTDPEENRFAYRFLNDQNATWSELSTKNVVVLSKLSPGTHRIEVKLYSVNNRWPPQTQTIHLQIQPPFWRTPFFIFSAVILFALMIYLIYRKRIRQINRQANIDKQLAQTEMKALHAQMNPHFIFNCLNSIREMILNNENEQASLYLSKFARLIRITLNHSSQQFVSLSDTIDYLERYIEMEKIRNTHFTYSMDVAKELNTDDILVPPMLIQPFIENAIWHGSSQKKNMNIHISFKKQEDQLICIVEDDGIGIEESLKRKENITHETSVGIDNIKQRIALLNEKYNLHSTIQIQDKLTLAAANSTGTIVTLHLPIKLNDNLWT